MSTIIMLPDQETALTWITEEHRMGGMHTKPMPFNLEKFRGLRDGLVRAGLVVKTKTGRYVPA